MPTPLRLSLIALAAVWFSMNIGCETRNASQRVQWAPVQVTDVSYIAGRWEGTLHRVHPPSQREDWIAVIIAPNGAYRFRSVRTIGVLSGQGDLQVADGRLTSGSERRSVDLGLYEAAGQRMLKFKSRGVDGEVYAADLTPR